MGVEVASDHDGHLGLEVRMDAEEVVKVGCMAVHVVVEVDQVERLITDGDLEVGGGCRVGQVRIDQALGTVGDASVRHNLWSVIQSGVVLGGVDVS
jgi:hypothetical protein